MASITSLSFPRSPKPTSSLPASNPPPCSGCLPVPCNLKHQQSATNTTCYSSGFLASHPRISPHNLVNSLCCCCCLGRKNLCNHSRLAGFPPWPYGPNASPPLAGKAELIIRQKKKKKGEPHMHPPAHWPAPWVFPRAVMRNVKQTPLIKGMFV